MKFDYQPVRITDHKGEDIVLHRPFLEVRLLKRGIRAFESLSLLDSGADIIIFPLHLGHFFEVPFKKGVQIPIQVAGGGVTFAYRLPFEIHKIEIHIGGKSVRTTIDFCEGQPYILLGQTFFEHFKVHFDRTKKTFELL